MTAVGSVYNYYCIIVNDVCFVGREGCVHRLLPGKVYQPNLFISLLHVVAGLAVRKTQKPKCVCLCLSLSSYE